MLGAELQGNSTVGRESREHGDVGVNVREGGYRGAAPPEAVNDDHVPTAAFPRHGERLAQVWVP